MNCGLFPERGGEGRGGARSLAYIVNNVSRCFERGSCHFNDILSSANASQWKNTFAGKGGRWKGDGEGCQRVIYVIHWTQNIYFSLRVKHVQETLMGFDGVGGGGGGWRWLCSSVSRPDELVSQLDAPNWEKKNSRQKEQHYCNVTGNTSSSPIPIGAWDAV